jgi:hypothetical protein
MSPFNLTGLKNFLLRLCLIPAFYFLLWIFYYDGFNEGLDVRLYTPRFKKGLHNTIIYCSII